MAEGDNQALEALVGTGKKFASVEDLAKGKLEADTFIEVLKGQISDLKTATAGLQTKADRTEALENLMAELNKKNNEGADDLGTVTPLKTADQPVILTQDDIVALIEQREVAKAAERNLETAKAELRKVYGDKVDETVLAKATALGLTVAQIEALGRSSTQAMLNLVGSPKQQTTQSATQGTRNSQALNDTTPGGVVRNATYYDGVKKEMGALKFVMDSSIQKQLHRDMMALGDAWES